MRIKPIFLFYQKELHQEFKHPTQLFAVLLYLICSTFIISLVTKGNITPSIWSALFWILMMFTGFNLMNKNLNHDEIKKWNYYYLLLHPIEFILSRIILHTTFLWILGILNFILFSFWIKNPVLSYDIFVTNIFLGSLGFATTLTLISSIAVQAQSPTMIMSVLGFPLIIPLLWTLIKVSLFCIQGLRWEEVSQYLFFLLSINGISIMLCLILFPILWRE